MTRRHITDNGDFNSARLTLLLCPMVNVTFAFEFLFLQTGTAY